jgi:hypothetical protein
MAPAFIAFSVILVVTAPGLFSTGPGQTFHQPCAPFLSYQHLLSVTHAIPLTRMGTLLALNCAQALFKIPTAAYLDAV